MYRLNTRNTVEAKIMGLQQFKLNIANSVVTQQNKSMEQMDTDRILDLFGPAPAPAASKAAMAARLAAVPSRPSRKPELIIVPGPS